MDLPDATNEAEGLLKEMLAVRSFSKVIPLDLNLKYERLAELYFAASESQREEITAAIPVDEGMKVLAYGERFAILAARTGEARYLRIALVSHAIEDARLDLRENILRLGLVTHVTNKIGASERQLFEEVIQVSRPEVAVCSRISWLGMRGSRHCTAPVSMKCWPLTAWTTCSARIHNVFARSLLNRKRASRCLSRNPMARSATRPTCFLLRSRC